MIAAGLDMGGTKTIVGFGNQKGEILYLNKFPTNAIDYDQYFSECIDELRKGLIRLGLTESDVVGLGISLNGMFNPTTGVLIRAPYLSWQNIPIIKFFETNTQFNRILAGNDVNLCAIGEQYFGNTTSDFVWITISTGIGGAIVADGNLLVGGNFCAGEIGHIKVEFINPRNCSCGQYGCLEAQSSGTAIGRAFRELIDTNPVMYAKLLSEVDALPDAKGCASLAKRGDLGCITIYEIAGKYIGGAVSHVLHLVNPKEIIFGGGVSRDIDLLLPSISSAINQLTIPECTNGVEIKSSVLGYEAALFGALAAVFRDSPLINY